MLHDDVTKTTDDGELEEEKLARESIKIKKLDGGDATSRASFSVVTMKIK